MAIKIINRKKLDEELIKLVNQEVLMLKWIQHPNIVRLYEIREYKELLFVIMEYARGGEVN